MNRFLFLDPGADVTRRDIYEMGRALGMDVVLLSSSLSWERDCVEEWVEGDPTDVAKAAAVAQAAGVVGVVNCSESCLEAAAAAAAACGAPGLSSELARACRDKVTMSELLTAAGIPMASRRVVVDEPEALAAAAELGFPGVLKPSTGVASLFTVKYSSPDELSRWFRAFARAVRDSAPAPLRSMRGRWLVEEFLEGPAFSVESVTSEGRVMHVAICEKGPIAPPFFREVGHSAPARITPAAGAELLELTERAITALGIDNCPTHTEFKLTPAGPRLLEIGARMGGGSIRQVVRLATGVDLVEVTLRLAMGLEPQVRPRAIGAAASRSLYPLRAGRVMRVDVDAMRRLPGVVAVNCWMEVGQEYELPPASGREVLGVVARSDNASAAISLADAAIVAAERAGLVELRADGTSG